MTTRRITLAVLDMAGTTVTDGGLVDAAFLDALTTVDIPADDPGNPERVRYVHDTMGQSKIEVFRHLLGDEQRAQAALAGFEVSIRQRIDDGDVAPLPGAVEAFAALHQRHVRVCLTTGFTAETQQRIIDRLGWDHLVDAALAPGPGVRGRPSPDLVLAAMLRLGVDDVRDVAVVGDTTSDLWCGHHAGAGIVAGVLTGAHDRDTLAGAPHTHIVDTVADLPQLVDLYGA